MPDILLTTLNAKFIHAAFGLRYLLANLGTLKPRAGLIEFDIRQRPLEIAEAILAQNPRIVGIGIYIWNLAPATELVAVLKRLRPDLRVILGGPEVSYDSQGERIVELSDYVITGEADLLFAELCQTILDGAPPAKKVHAAPPPEFTTLQLPYDLYSDADIANRILYVEASRGCPFSCEFCLSSLDIPIRQAPLDLFLNGMDELLRRGARQLKFVDRTFNLNIQVSRTILEFLLARYQPGHFFHFEMVPDRLPEELREIIVRFPAGALQFEVGIQTFNPEVSDLIHRRQNLQRLEENLRFLRTQTGVHIHADLIAGLPGETLESFAAGFDRLVGLGPHEIQLGILKRLKGTPISRHDEGWAMVYTPHPPYEILQNRLIDFPTMQRLRRFARFWDLVANSGNFLESTPLIWASASAGLSPSPFQRFLQWSDWLYSQTGRTDSISLLRLMEFLFRYLTDVQRLSKEQVAEAIWRDYLRGGREDKPGFLKNHLADSTPTRKPGPGSALPKRQARHIQASSG